MVGRPLRTIVVAAATALFGVVTSAWPGDAAAPVDLAGCGGATKVVVAGSSVALAGPVFVARDRGIVQDFLNANRSTLVVGGDAANANDGWSAPARHDDPAVGRVWSTSWHGQIAAPGIGAPVVVSLTVRLAHPIPDLLVAPPLRPAKVDPAGLRAGCTLAAGVPLTAGASASVRTADGGLRVSLPAGAITTDVTLVVQPAAPTLPAAVGTQAGPAYEITTTAPITLVAPVELTLAFGATSAPHAVHVVGHSASDAAGVWHFLPSDVDPIAGTASAATRHFSTYTTSATPGFNVIGGHVSARATGAAIANIRVVVEDVATWEDRYSTTTDAFGDYSVLVADNASYKVVFYSQPGMSWAAQRWNDQLAINTASVISITNADVVANATLDPGYALHGVVSDVNGLPIAGAFVDVLQAATLFSAAESITASDGSYWIVVRQGAYKLRLVGPPAPAAYLPQWYPDRSVPDAGATTFSFAADQLLNVTMQPGVRVSGTYSYVVAPGSYKLRFQPPAASGLAAQWDAARASFGSADVRSFTLGTTPRVDEMLSPGVAITGVVTDRATGARSPVRTSVPKKRSTASSRPRRAS